ncbi:hypothetical protein OR60_17760 [Xanthomonas vesicatoria]|uniref:DUF2523 family protein n=1 Tax=Xanthomonas vesicatoria TaxID=56460 RepID=UPI000573E454|nr:DUF2523 family protein [Xanthomonas vesicatoria]KHM92077.1 hypothetical protein OR60_17760 [Xanthomonas vesicatoria]
MGMTWDWIGGAVGLLVGKLKDAAAGMAGKAFTAFGVTAVSFETVLPRLKELVTEKVSLLPGPALDLLGYLGVGQVISMVLSALMVQMSWKVFFVPKTVADQLGANQ